MIPLKIQIGVGPRLDIPAQTSTCNAITRKHMFNYMSVWKQRLLYPPDVRVVGHHVAELSLLKFIMCRITHVLILA